MEGIIDLHENGIMKEGQKLAIKFVFSSDWKFLALLMGIKNATSTYYCPWCNCDKHSRNNLQFDWSEAKFMRKWGENKSLCYECKDEPRTACARNNHSYKMEKNLLKFPFNENNTVLDTLHTVLRTSEILEKELKNRAQNYNLNLKLQQLAKDSSGISFFYFIFRF